MRKMASKTSGVAGPAEGSGAASVSFRNENDYLGSSSEGLPTFNNTESGLEVQPSCTVAPHGSSIGDDFSLLSQFHEAATGQDGDEILLHPVPREIIWSNSERKLPHGKQHLYIQKHFDAGDIIRLLPQAVHIRIDPQMGLNIDPGLQLPPVPPKRQTLLPRFQMIGVGVIPFDPSRDVPRQDFNLDRWAYDTPIYIRVFAEEWQSPKAYYADASGRIFKGLDMARIRWNPEFESYEKRAGTADTLCIEVKSQMQVADKLFRKAAKKYRTSRRLWEIMVVEHEFFETENRDLFHPVCDWRLVRRMIRMGKEDIENDEAGGREYRGLSKA